MDRDPYRYFRIEAREVIAQLGTGVLALEKTGGDAELVSRLLRLAHTIKGAARIVKQREIADLAHQIEDALGPFRGHDVPPGRRDDMLALIDRMSAHVAALPEPPAPPSDAPARPRADDIAVLPRTDTASIDELIGALADIHAQINRLRATPSLDALGPRVERLDRELRQVRLDAERLRLMPAGAVFGSLERAARDAALGGKRIVFTARGTDVRVDATVLTALHGALVQLVRNAVAHGIETPDARRAAGKPDEGHVDLEVTLLGTRARFACRDDGRGIDLAAVRRAAARRDPKAASVDDDQLVALLLRGGLTTSTTITEIAGRGIGLDVVREAAARLGGEVTATSKPGAGTTIVITVPVSLAAVPSLIVEASGHVAAIPLHAIRRIERITEGSIIRAADGLAIAYDDVTITYASLARLLGARPNAAPARTAVVVGSADAIAAIAVDQLHGVNEVVVRALPDAPIDPIVFGVMLDDDGQPRPVLDPVELVAAARKPGAPIDPTSDAPPPILVVDDSLTTRMLEQSILESAGYTVETASSAEEALDKANQRRYALFLVDVEMPGMDGFGFVAEVRRRPQLAAIPAIMVTSRGTPDDRRRGDAAGANGFMAKGEFDQLELLAMIRRLVS